MPDPRMRLNIQQARDATLPAVQTRLRSLRIRSTIITFSARSLAECSSSARCRRACLLARRPAARALDRPGQTVLPVLRRNSSGDHAGHGSARQADEGGVGRPQVGHRVQNASSGSPVKPASSLRQMFRLEDVAAPDVFDGPGDRGLVFGGRRHQPEVPAGVLAWRRDRCTGAAGQVIETALEGLSPVVGPQSLEEPGPGRVVRGGGRGRSSRTTTPAASGARRVRAAREAVRAEAEAKVAIQPPPKAAPSPRTSGGRPPPTRAGWASRGQARAATAGCVSALARS